MKIAYINGTIYTGSENAEDEFAQAFLVEDGYFTLVSTTEEALLHNPDQIVDLSGDFVCAGFNDSHMHLLSFGDALNAVPLHLHTRSLSDMILAMKDFWLEKEDQIRDSRGWLIGRGWNQDYFTDQKRMPDRRDLDQISTEVPIAAVRCCGHCVSVNSKALEIAQITSETIAPEGGSIGMKQGEPDGLFFDNAMALVMDYIPVPDKETIKKYLLDAIRVMNSYGVTSCQSDDYCVFRSVTPEIVNEAYRELEEEGILTLRVYQQANFENIDDLREFVEAGNLTGAGTARYKIGPLKMLGDGSLGARTAYLREPYADKTGELGLPVFSQEEFDQMIGYAHEHGMQCAVHAIGDACLDNFLRAYEKALALSPRQDHRHGIVHCQISGADQLDKMAELNLHIYAQTIFLDYDIHIVEDRVGKERAATSYNWKTLMNKGLHVSNGTDCPVEMPDALRGMQCAITRKTIAGDGPYLEDQAFTVKEALDSFTKEGAYASFEEQIKGRIKEGYLADFIVLGLNPFVTPVSKIHEISVKATYLEGKCSHWKSTE